MASPKRFTRKAAQKQLDEFLQRCRELNSQSPSLDTPETICRVDSVILYGSFAKDDTSDVGDVDLCLILSIRHRDLYRKYNTESFKQFGTAEALNRNPDFLARKMLQKGLTILSVASQLPEGVTGVTLLKKMIKFSNAFNRSTASIRISLIVSISSVVKALSFSFE